MGSCFSNDRIIVNKISPPKLSSYKKNADKEKRKSRRIMAKKLSGLYEPEREQNQNEESNKNSLRSA